MMPNPSARHPSLPTPCRGEVRSTLIHRRHGIRWYKILLLPMNLSSRPPLPNLSDVLQNGRDGPAVPVFPAS